MTGIRPCAKFAGFPGSDARTMSLVAPSVQPSAISVLPTTFAVAVSGSRLFRRVNANPVAPSKYEFRSTRAVSSVATMTGRGDPENRGGVGVDSSLMVSATGAHQVTWHAPANPSAVSP